jgi:uncharacterized protein
VTWRENWLPIGIALALSACDSQPESPPPVKHAVHYFEIPVTDMVRAVSFYEQLLKVSLTEENVDGYEMALFPFKDGAAGASGALAKGDIYVPSKNGSIVYFRVKDLTATVALSDALGSKLLYPIKDIGDGGKVAEIEDSEGNRIALHQPK